MKGWIGEKPRYNEPNEGMNWGEPRYNEPNEGMNWAEPRYNEPNGGWLGQNPATINQTKGWIGKNPAIMDQPKRWKCVWRCECVCVCACCCCVDVRMFVCEYMLPVYAWSGGENLCQSLRHSRHKSLSHARTHTHAHVILTTSLFLEFFELTRTCFS